MIKVLIASSKINQRWSEKIWEQIIWSDHEMRAKILTYDADDEKCVDSRISCCKICNNYLIVEQLAQLYKTYRKVRGEPHNPEFNRVQFEAVKNEAL